MGICPQPSLPRRQRAWDRARASSPVARRRGRGSSGPTSYPSPTSPLTREDRNRLLSANGCPRTRRILKHPRSLSILLAPAPWRACFIPRIVDTSAPAWGDDIVHLQE